jgi:hypothetical protein
MTLAIKDIKEGDTFYECEYGANDEYIALENASRIDDDTMVGWQVMGKHTETGAEVQFFASDLYGGAYGPKLYWQPAYY